MQLLRKWYAIEDIQVAVRAAFKVATTIAILDAIVDVDRDFCLED
jgi:hypothetical protein